MVEILLSRRGPGVSVCWLSTGENGETVKASVAEGLNAGVEYKAASVPSWPAVDGSPSESGIAAEVKVVVIGSG